MRRPSLSSSWTRGRFFSIGLVALTLLRIQQVRTFLDNEIIDESTAHPTLDKQSTASRAQRDIVHAPVEKQAATVDSQSDDDTATPHYIHDATDNVTIDTFNYTAYWELATKAAFDSLNNSITYPPSPCPKVYIYDLPSKLKDSTKKEWGFGKKVLLRGPDKQFQGLLYNTNQYALPSILEERLQKSKVCRTRDPTKADLFYVPIFAAPKGVDEWKAACGKISGEDVRDALPHLNASNACRHFFAFGKGHYIGEYCPGWFSDPIPELQPFLRLAYSHVAFDIHLNGTHSYTRNSTLESQYPNLFSVPYPSSMHLSKSKKTPQFQKLKRKSLMSYIGKNDHGDTMVRKQISTMCQGYKDKKVCSVITTWATKHATEKSKATFCLEPAGDSPWRKSLADSISFGCIPVLFSELTDDVAPWFWNDWKDRARVVVPRDEFVAGRIDLKKLLESIPPQLFELMQTTLREKARQFQYSADEDEEDGIRVILDNLQRQVKDRERRGVCGYRKELQHT